MNGRKIEAMHKLFGTCETSRCRDCTHLISREYHDRRYHKCELYGLTCSEATDWRLSYPACGMYCVPQDMDRWVPVIDWLRRSPKKAAPQVPGQVEFEI